jgi:hypothetical protein
VKMKSLLVDASFEHKTKQRRGAYPFPFLKGVLDMPNDVIIHRPHKHEAEMAISDLEKRGYILTYNLTEIKKDGKTFTRDSFNRRIFVENTGSSCWIAKLRRGEQWKQ